MAALRLYAISIDEARDFVGASPATAERARAAAADLFEAPAVPTRGSGLFTRLFGRSPRTPEPPDPGRPTVADLETVLDGHYPTPDRALPCWQVLEHLVARSAWGHHEVDLDDQGLEHFDFAVVRAGGSAETGLARLVDTDARIGLSQIPELRVGYMPYAQVRNTGARLARLEVTAEDEYAAAIDGLRHFLGQYGGWAAEALDSESPTPDLLAFHTVG